jgi:[ribosomal protein S18]-alanine N-acetyltransferase
MTHGSTGAGLPGPGGTMVLIRGIDDSDIGAVAKVDAEVFRDLAYPYFALRQLLDVHRRHCLVLDCGDCLLGYSLGALGGDPKTGWLLGLGVLPALRGRGYGAELARRTVGRLRADGAESVLLTVEPDNAAAIHIYEAQGFEIAGYDASYFGPREGRLIMSLEFGGRRSPVRAPDLEPW